MQKFKYGMRYNTVKQTGTSRNSSPTKSPTKFLTKSPTKNKSPTKTKSPYKSPTKAAPPLPFSSVPSGGGGGTLRRRAMGSVVIHKNQAASNSNLNSNSTPGQPALPNPKTHMAEAATTRNGPGTLRRGGALTTFALLLLLPLLLLLLLSLLSLSSLFQLGGALGTLQRNRQTVTISKHHCSPTPCPSPSNTMTLIPQHDDHQSLIVGHYFKARAERIGVEATARATRCGADR
jgi:hypothetical protein